MSFFGFGKKISYLGIDIGTTSIKLVELTKENGVPTLLTYGYAERPLDDVVHNDPDKVKQESINLLAKIYKRSGAISYKATTALPNFSVFTSVISLPIMPKKELAEAIRWEAKKFIPIPLEDVVLDWEIIEEKVEGGKNISKETEGGDGQKEIKTEESQIKNKTFTGTITEKASIPSEKEEKLSETRNGTAFIRPTKKIYRILLTAASKNLVQRYIDIFKAADLQLLSLETEAFALSRALIGKDETVSMVIDTSAVTTDIIIIENGLPILNRSIDVGGVTLTRALANALKIDFRRAEQFKRDIGLSDESKIPAIIEQAFKPVVDEINYSLNLYQSQTGRLIEKIILSGGSAYLNNLSNYLSNILKVKVLIGDPWARIAYPAELRPALEEIAPRFAVAVGLALRQLE
ncbi:MAG: pilus assembly protein PilM [Patescibacteria group bacterium]